MKTAVRGSYLSSRDVQLRVLSRFTLRIVYVYIIFFLTSYKYIRAVSLSLSSGPLVRPTHAISAFVQSVQNVYTYVLLSFTLFLIDLVTFVLIKKIANNQSTFFFIIAEFNWLCSYKYFRYKKHVSGRYKIVKLWIIIITSFYSFNIFFVFFLIFQTRSMLRKLMNQ